MSFQILASFISRPILSKHLHHNSVILLFVSLYMSSNQFSSTINGNLNGNLDNTTTGSTSSNLDSSTSGNLNHYIFRFSEALDQDGTGPDTDS